MRPSPTPRGELPPEAPPTSVAELFERHADVVARWAQRLGGPGVDVEDVVQDVFLVAQRKWGSFRGEAKASTWLFRITHHVARARRRKNRLFGWLAGAREDVARGTVDVHADPLAEVTRKQSQRDVHRALERLNDNYRTVLVLFELEGHSGEEIAELLGIRVEAVWVRLHRARRAFAARVAELAPKEER